MMLSSLQSRLPAVLPRMPIDAMPTKPIGTVSWATATGILSVVAVDSEALTQNIDTF
jgi:hypothetical protein